MAEQLQVYKCEVCGNIIEVLHGGDGELVCCGQPMKLIKENTVDAAKEKHVPVVEKTADGFKVKVGSVAHPMEEKHYIEWVETHRGRQGLPPVPETRAGARGRFLHQGRQGQRPRVLQPAWPVEGLTGC